MTGARGIGVGVVSIPEPVGVGVGVSAGGALCQTLAIGSGKIGRASCSERVLTDV